MAIRIAVKTTWQGKVGIRDKYIEEARQNHEDILVFHDSTFMKIPYAHLDDLIIATSDKRFRDRYHNDPHYLIYFLWKPEGKQGRLLINA